MQILIADEQALLRDALRVLIEERGHEVVAEAETAAQAVALARRREPDVALLGLTARRAETMAAARTISRDIPSTAVVILAPEAREADAVDALRHGARGFLTRDLHGPIFCAMLERAGAGELAMSAPFTRRVLEAYARRSGGHHLPDPAIRLTRREREVLEHMSRGITSNRELAEALAVSQNTVRFHVRNVLEKLHLHTRAAAVAHALTHGIVSSDVD